MRYSRSDIRSSDWATPAHREATTKHFKLCQAREEITRLDVEVRRLCTAIHDEEFHVSAIIQDLLISNPQLGKELQCQCRARMAINAVHSSRLDRIERLPGFSGIRGVGVHLHSTLSSNDAESAHPAHAGKLSMRICDSD